MTAQSVGRMPPIPRDRVCDSSYQECTNRFGEQGVVDLVALVGYFTLISNVTQHREHAGGRRRRRDAAAVSRASVH
jgi:hypothetical protein